MKRTMILNEETYNIKIEQSTAVLFTVNINIAFRSSYLWRWNRRQNYYWLENTITKIKQSLRNS